MEDGLGVRADTGGPLGRMMLSPGGGSWASVTAKEMMGKGWICLLRDVNGLAFIWIRGWRG